LEKVGKVLLPRNDMLDADGRCDSVVTARVQAAWKKFRDTLTHMKWKRIFTKTKRQNMHQLCEELYD